MPSELKIHKYENLSEANLKRFVLPKYNLEQAKITQIKFKDTEKQRAVYKVETSENIYCLKKVYFDEPELLFVYSAIEWLYRHNMNVPRILSTKGNGKYVLYDEMLFILTPWIDGTKCSYDNIQHILDASGCLASLHNCTTNFTPIQGSSHRKGCENITISLQKHFNQLLTCSNLAFKYKDKFSKTLLNNFDVNLELGQIAMNTAASINNGNLSISLCHMDYVNKNLIFDQDNKLWVIDFDKCKIDYCVHDISYFLRRLLKRDNTKWNLEIAVNALNIYETKRSLNIDEYKYILAYLSFPHKFWKICRDYYNNITKCNKNSFQTLLNKSIEKSDYHLQFINEFKNYLEMKFNTKI